MELYDVFGFHRCVVMCGRCLYNCLMFYDFVGGLNGMIGVHRVVSCLRFGKC